MDDNTTDTTKAKERTFKDDVLSLVSIGKDNDFFDYYEVSLNYPVIMVNVDKKAIVLRYDEDGTKVLIDYIYASPYSTKQLDLYTYRLSNPNDRRAFAFRLYFNMLISQSKTIEEHFLLSKSRYALNKCKIYFPCNPTSKKEMENKIEIFNKVHSQVFRSGMHVYSICYLFYCVFFNEYSNIGLLDNYCICLSNMKEDVKDCSILLKGINEKDIKEVIAHQAKMYHKMQEEMDLITSSRDTAE